MTIKNLMGKLVKINELIKQKIEVSDGRTLKVFKFEENKLCEFLNFYFSLIFLSLFHLSTNYNYFRAELTSLESGKVDKKALIIFLNMH